MNELDYSSSGIAIREDIVAAQNEIWEWLRRPGTWWTGAQRVAIAAESRSAVNCPYCRDRKAALSAAGVAGKHTGLGKLAPHLIEIIHQIRTDPARLSRAWFERSLATGISEGEYVELVGVVTLLAGVDYFARALGVPPFALPEPIAGEPSRYRPTSAKSGIAWVPMIAPVDASGPEADLYPPAPMIPNIMRALSLVPDNVRILQLSTNAHYLPVAQIGDPTTRGVLDRMQMEIVAARVSAINECFY